MELYLKVCQCHKISPYSKAACELVSDKPEQIQQFVARIASRKTNAIRIASPASPHYTELEFTLANPKVIFNYLFIIITACME